MNNKNKIIFSNKSEVHFSINSKIYGKFVVIVDSNKIKKLKKYTWHIQYSKLNKRYIGVFCLVGNKHTSLHNFITGYPMCDHRDGDVFNNRIGNLRKCNHYQNCKNRKIGRNNTSGFKGVSFDKKSKKWAAYIQSDNKKYHIGLFKTPEDAAKAYNESAIFFHKEFAKLNAI